MQIELAASSGLGMSIFGLIALAFAGSAYGVYRLISRRQPPGGYGSTPYECGEEPEGPSHGIFQPRYYVVALIFLLFEVEVAFLFPWAVGGFVRWPIDNESTEAMPMLAFYEGLLFIGLLAFGLIFAWAQGMLDWALPAPPKPAGPANAGEKYQKAFPGGKKPKSAAPPSQAASL